MFNKVELAKIKTDVGTVPEAQAALKQIVAEMLACNADAGDPTKHQLFTKAASDIEAIHVSLAKAEKDAAKAIELAQDAVRSPVGKVSAKALGALPLVYLPKGEVAAMFGAKAGQISKGGVAHYNLLMYAQDDLQGFDADMISKITRFRYLNGQLETMHAIMMGQSPQKRQDYIAAGGRETLPLWGEWVELSREFKAAMDTAESGAGSQWVPTGVNLTLIPDVRPEHNSRNMIQTYSMSRSPQLFPVQGTSFRAFLLGESTDVHRSATALGPRDSATANVTFTAKKLGALTDYSSELLEDSIVQLATAVRVDHAYANGESMESALWNGQLTGMGGSAAASSTLDTGVTFVITTNQVDDRAAWDGWRQLYATGTCTTAGDAGAGLIADLFTDQLGAMGKFGYDPSQQFIGTSFAGHARLLVLKDSANQNVALTSEKAGGNGTFKAGVLTQAFGRDVVCSTQYPTTLNASGAIDGSSTKTAFHIVNRSRFGLGEVRLLQIAASDQVAFDTDQIVIRSTWRGQMKPYVAPNSTTEISIGAIFNV